MTSPETGAHYDASVVIPAHDEEQVIGRCLSALAPFTGADASPRLEVVVVANGCSDRTVEVARRFDVTVLDLATGSKSAALNEGDRVATAFPRIYLDADIVLSPDAIPAMVETLTTSEARVAAPRIVFDVAGASPLVRSWYRAYEKLPYVSDGLVGLGVYGMSAAGRARFEEFPAVHADDLFVQRLFDPDERRTTGGTFTVTTPRVLDDLIKVRTRVARGNAELADGETDAAPDEEQSRFAATTTSTSKALVDLVRRRPADLPDVLTYSGVTVAARLKAGSTDGSTWHRDDSSRRGLATTDLSTSPEESAVSVAYLTSQYPALSHTFIEREVRAVRACGMDVATYSVRPCPPEELRSEAMREDAATTPTLRGSSASTWAQAASSLGRRNPRVFAAGLRRALASGPMTPKGRTWQLFYLAEAVLLYERLRARGITHVHAHFANVSTDVARLVTHLGRTEDGPDSDWRWSFTMHGPTEFESVEAHDLPAKVRDADGVSCISDFARSQLMRFVEPEHWPKLEVVRMSVDANRYRPAENSPERPADAPLRLLYVGRLVPEKGSPVLLDAVGRLRDAGVATHTRIVGAGRLHDTLAATIAEHALGDSVELVGPVGQDQLPELYRESDVFVLPSFSEGLPVVLMEAMASGVPVITTQIAAVGEMVHDGEHGRVVPPGRADLLADAIADLASDAGRRAEMGRAGREVILREFVPEVTGPAMTAFLSGVPAGRR